MRDRIKQLYRELFSPQDLGLHAEKAGGSEVELHLFVEEWGHYFVDELRSKKRTKSGLTVKVINRM